ncbi:MAG TPA: hypothetical protein VFQ45_12285, partial [Longimicrobium sp.]|nr:hypothetical protein [Longimicrobium sp.]
PAASIAACSDGADEPDTPRARPIVIAPAGPDSGAVGTGLAASGAGFAPDEYPLAWKADGVVIAHAQRYRRGARADSTCRGSGFYELSRGRARPIAIGPPACTGAFSGIAAADPEGRTVVYPAAPDFARLPALIRHPLQVWYTDTIVTGCGGRFTRLAVSADLEQLAAVGRCAEGGAGPAALHLMMGNGNGLQAVLGNEEGEIGHIAWSAFGLSIVLDQRKPGEEPSLNWFILGERALVKLADGTDPAWSPTGEWIAFLAEGRGGRAEIRRVPSVRGSRPRLVYRAAPGEPPPGGPLVWSPDGRSLLFTRRSPRGTTIWRVDLRTRTATPVTGRDTTASGR